MKKSGQVVGATRQQLVPIIAEIKRAIPALPDRPVDTRLAAKLAEVYQQAGAIMISVVTEKAHFAGQPELDLPAILQTTDLPVLVKDFVTTQAQIDEYLRIIDQVDSDFRSRVYVLLIAHRLPAKELSTLVRYSRAHQLGVCIELRVHEPLPHIEDSDQILFLFNNRDIDHLEVEPKKTTFNSTFVRKFRKKYGNAFLIGASGYHTSRAVTESLAAGADAILLGTVLMTATQPEQTLAAFVKGTYGS